MTRIRDELTHDLHGRVLAALEYAAAGDIETAIGVLSDLDTELADESTSKSPVARILSLCPAPAPLVDRHGNIIAGYALVEFDGERRDVVPFGTDGGCFGLGDVAYYEAHALGDHRPGGARFADSNDDSFESLS